MQNIQNESELPLPSNPILGQEGKEHLTGGQPSQGNSIPKLVEPRFDKQEGTSDPNKPIGDFPLKVWSGEENADKIRPANSTEVFCMKTCEHCFLRGTCHEFCDMGPWICDDFLSNRIAQAKDLALQWLHVLGKYQSRKDITRIARKLLREWSGFRGGKI